MKMLFVLAFFNVASISTKELILSGAYVSKSFTGKSVIKLRKNGSFTEKGYIPKHSIRYKIKGTWKVGNSEEGDTIITLFNDADSVYVIFKKKSDCIIDLRDNSCYKKR